MLSSRRHARRSGIWSNGPAGEMPTAPRRRPAAGPGRGADRSGPLRAVGTGHPLADAAANARLQAYEARVKQAFDGIVPTLKRLSALQHETDFEARAQRIARSELGFELPGRVLADAWVTQLDMRALFAWCVFETYRRVSDEFFDADPLGGREGEAFERFVRDCGFHLMDVTPCADGRLAHAISYVLRLPYGPVRRRSYAGALFDVEDTVQKWVETELLRYREGRPNTADAPTRYLKAVVYHFSSADPGHEGCAAHGSDDAKAARAGLERLQAFRQAIENSFCCGASVDLLLIGMDTDTDAIRVHVPDREGRFDLERTVDARDAYEATRSLAPDQGRARIEGMVRERAPGEPEDGMVRLVARLLENNLSQIDYVRSVHGGAYPDFGHAERFIGAGIGFEEIQLRNLTYFAYLNTVEEGAADLDVGIKIFKGLNVSRGLPVPVVVRFDYHGQVPGGRERAVEHCERVCRALAGRYPELRAQGLLHTLRTVRDCDAGGRVEVVGSSLEAGPQGAH
jgi:carboxysome shell carbonic anhydrase